MQTASPFRIKHGLKLVKKISSRNRFEFSGMLECSILSYKKYLFPSSLPAFQSVPFALSPDALAPSAKSSAGFQSAISALLQGHQCLFVLYLDPFCRVTGAVSHHKKPYSKCCFSTKPSASSLYITAHFRVFTHRSASPCQSLGHERG